MLYKTIVITLNERETLIWLSGILEGEGSFMKGPPSSPNQPVISMTTTDLDVAQRVASVFGRKLTYVKKRNTKWKQSYLARIDGRRAIEWMNRLRPYMSERRQKQIDCAVESYQPKYFGKRPLTNEQILEIKYLAKQMSMRSVGGKFNISHSTVSRILADKTYK